MQRPFIGREHELELLNSLMHKKTASLVVINGRRRIGKSRLVNEFARGKAFYQFSGLAPDEGVTAQDQRNEFALGLTKQLGLPPLNVEDWSHLFHLLAEKVSTGQHIIFFDEITWMANGDPTFLSKLKNAWDMYFSKNPKLSLIICGSISAWIEKNIISSTGYFGRLSLHITLKELPLPRCIELLEELGFKHSMLEKLRVLSLTGCIPWYIEQIKPNQTAEKNINQLCFDAHGLLLNEFKAIFHDLFGKRSDIYQRIVKLLVNGPLEYSQISDKLNYSKGSALSDYLGELVTSGYLKCHQAWDISSGDTTSLSKYHLSDNFLRFYLKYIEPRLNAIGNGTYQNVHLSALPGWSGMIGLQFENLILNNRMQIIESLSINPTDIINDGPYFQRTTLRQKGCQIDYLIQTRTNTLYVCEIKFSMNPIKTSVIKDVKEKISRLASPKQYATLPVLIHANDIESAVEEQEYFYKIIDITE